MSRSLIRPVVKLDNKLWWNDKENGQLKVPLKTRKVYLVIAMT